MCAQLSAITREVLATSATSATVQAISLPLAATALRHHATMMRAIFCRELSQACRILQGLPWLSCSKCRGCRGGGGGGETELFSICRRQPTVLG